MAMKALAALEFERARNGLLTHSAYDVLGPCRICGDWHIQQDTADYVYHQSMGIVCAKHHGVKEYYEKLISEANQTLKNEGILL